MMEKRKVVVLLIWFFLFAGVYLGLSSSALAIEKIILKNNAVIKGKIIKDEGNQIIIEEYKSKAFLTIPRSSIVRVILKKPESFASAQALFKKGDYAEAAKLYTQVVKEYGNYDWAQKALFQAGRAYMKLKRWDQAGQTFQKYLKSYPRSSIFHEVNLYFAQALACQGHHEKAALLYENILKIKGKENLRAEAQYDLAELYLAGKEYEKALMGYLRIVVVFYNQTEWVPGAMFKAGLCYEKLGDAGRAMQMYKETVADYPRTESARLSREKLSVLTQKGEKAK